MPTFTSELEIYNFKYHNCQVYRNASQEPHRLDGPAVIGDEGVAWYASGQLHRNNFPAVEKIDGTQMFFRYGKLDRKDGPAVIYPNGDQEFWDAGAFVKIVKKPVEYKETSVPGKTEEITFGRIKATFNHENGRTYVELPDGTKEYSRHGLLHRESGPAVEKRNGEFGWYIDGRPHRDDGVAVKKEGREYYYFHGMVHREGGPAIIGKDEECWMEFNKIHRIGGPALKSSSVEIWMERGMYHRDSGPAVISGNRKEYWVRDKRHRTDGPAIEDGELKEFWLDGVHKTEAEFNKLTGRDKVINKTGSDVLTRVMVGQATKLLQNKMYPKSMEGTAANLINWTLGMTLNQVSDNSMVQKIGKELRVQAQEDYLGGIFEELKKALKNVELPEPMKASKPVEIEELEIIEEKVEVDAYRN